MGLLLIAKKQLRLRRCIDAGAVGRGRKGFRTTGGADAEQKTMEVTLG